MMPLSSFQLRIFSLHQNWKKQSQIFTSLNARIVHFKALQKKRRRTRTNWKHWASFAFHVSILSSCFPLIHYSIDMFVEKKIFIFFDFCHFAISLFSSIWHISIKLIWYVYVLLSFLFYVCSFLTRVEVRLWQ